MTDKIITTNEIKLKDHKGFEVYKVIDNKGISNEKITYMLNDKEGNNINCFRTLRELRNYPV